MEPHPHECGNVRGDLQPRHRHSRFNGATSSRMWKLTVWTILERPHVGFNGATSSRMWKPLALLAAASPACALQWSHILTNVETFDARQAQGRANFASMEPHPHECGNVMCP